MTSYSLWVTCSDMHRICGDPAIDRRLALDRCSHGALSGNDLGDYYALLPILTQLDILKAFFHTRIPILFMENHSPRPCLDDLARATDGGHNLVAYLVAILLYRYNGDASDDDTMRR